MPSFSFRILQSKIDWAYFYTKYAWHWIPWERIISENRSPRRTILAYQFHNHPTVTIDTLDTPQNL